MKKFIALVNGKYTIKANTVRGLKIAASRKANAEYNTHDSMLITHIGGYPVGEYAYHRFNKKAPNNTIKRGQWR